MIRSVTKSYSSTRGRAIWHTAKERVTPQPVNIDITVLTKRGTLQNHGDSRCRGLCRARNAAAELTIAGKYL